jgi:hypothetical protein
MVGGSLRLLPPLKLVAMILLKVALNTNKSSILITIISCDYLNLSLANEYVGDVTIPTQVIKHNQNFLSSTNKIDSQNKTEILLKLVLNNHKTTKPTIKLYTKYNHYNKFMVKCNNLILIF